MDEQNNSQHPQTVYPAGKAVLHGPVLPPSEVLHKLHVGYPKSLSTGKGSKSLGTILQRSQLACCLPALNRHGVHHPQDNRVDIPLYVDTCSMGAGAVFSKEAYHIKFPLNIIDEGHCMCHL